MRQAIKTVNNMTPGSIRVGNAKLMIRLAEVARADREGRIRFRKLDQLPVNEQDEPFEFYDEAGNVQRSDNSFLDEFGNPYHDRPETF